MQGQHRSPIVVAALGLVALVVGVVLTLAGRSQSTAAPIASASWAATPGDSPTTIDDPVIPSDFPDPFVLPDHGVYYAYATNSATDNIPTYWSSDLRTWTAGPDALPTLPRWAIAGGFLRLTWAPSVVRYGSGYVMFYAAGDRKTGLECISRAEGSAPLGPFTDDSRQPLICQTRLGGDIDPDVFTDRNGSSYLLWKSNGNCCGIPTELWSEPLSPDGTSVVGRPVALLTDNQAWEAGVIEGPSMVQVGTVFYLFFSGNAWNTADYAVGYAVCSSPEGPCTEPIDRSLYASDSSTSGPGGQTFFTTSQGSLLMAYAAWSRGRVDDAGGARSMRLDPVTFASGFPQIKGPDVGSVVIP